MTDFVHPQDVAPARVSAAPGIAPATEPATAAGHDPRAGNSTGKWSRSAYAAGLLVCAMLSGCGYVGDPQPPTLHIPMPPQELTAKQRGSQLDVAFHYAKVTTDGLAMQEWNEAELRVGPAPVGDFNVDVWAASAKRVPVSSLNTSVPARLETPVAEFAGKEIICGVRAAGPKGRWSPWSNLVTLAVVPPLPKPAGLEAAASAEGVRLTWSASPVQAGAFYRVSRQAAGEESMQPLADAKASPFTDSTAEYGKEYRYRVQTIWKDGEREVESDASDAVTINPVDTFPPAVPAGLNSILGVNSIELSWDRNTDVDFRGYYIYRAAGEAQFARIGGPVESPAFSDKTIEPGRLYRYAISAVDGAGNESARSTPIAVTAPQ